MKLDIDVASIRLNDRQVAFLRAVATLTDPEEELPKLVVDREKSIDDREGLAHLVTFAKVSGGFGESSGTLLTQVDRVSLTEMGREWLRLNPLPDSGS